MAGHCHYNIGRRCYRSEGSPTSRHAYASSEEQRYHNVPVVRQHRLGFNESYYVHAERCLLLIDTSAAATGTI